MLTIILAICLAVLVVFLVARFIGEGIELVLTLATAVILLSIVVGLFVPVTGYTDWKPTKRIELVSLNNSTIGGSKGFIYVSVSSDNVYSYRYEVDSEFGTMNSKEYVLATVSGSNVVEVEDATIETPYLQIYERKGKKSAWSFAFFQEEEKYVFYVPVGSIEKNTNLK